MFFFRCRRVLSAGLLAAALITPALAAQTTDERLRQMEGEIAALKAEVARLAAAPAPAPVPAADPRLGEIERRLDVLAGEIEKMKIGEAAAVASADTAQHGLGPAASKIYRTGRGVSIGGYGEALYSRFPARRDDGVRSGEIDRFDFLRGVLYAGYKWNDRWLLNTELEWEHANTDKGGEAAVEFAYIDYLYKPELSWRAGLLLMPVGFLNELHEPTVFLGARRPDVERFIIPTTWREGGFGLFGEKGPFSYRAYVVTGLDASGFSADEGLHEGSAEGANAKADGLAGVVRLDYTPTPGLLVGGSAYHGRSGQGLRTAEGRQLQVGTDLFEGHAEWKWRGLELRALGVEAHLGDIAALDRILELDGVHSVGERLRGGYVQVAYDLFARGAHGEQALLPFLRWERFDTQVRVPTGFQRDAANDRRSWTLGLSYRPIDAVVLKADYQNFDNRAGSALDQFHVALGYIF